MTASALNQPPRPTGLTCSIHTKLIINKIQADVSYPLHEGILGLKNRDRLKQEQQLCGLPVRVRETIENTQKYIAQMAAYPTKENIEGVLGSPTLIPNS